MTEIPEEITLEWLKAQEDGGQPNAHILALGGQFSSVPEQLVAEALGILDVVDGRITLHWILSGREGATQVDKKHFVRKLLITCSKGGTTPLKQAAYSGCLDLIPWDTFNARSWLPHLELLQQAERVATPFGDSLNLSRFLRRLEKLSEIKQTPSVDLESDDKMESDPPVL